MRILNLPPQPTSFIGRQEELSEISDLLSLPACRLITLLGPGGIGKTRLALQAASLVADNFEDGAVFVDLQPVSSAEFLVPAIASSLQFTFIKAESPQEQLFRFLREKQVLLVLDNFEHMLESAGVIADLLASAPQVKMIITSREALNLQEEWLRPVQGLSYPDRLSSKSEAGYSALQLFAQRARRVQPDFSLDRDWECAARICSLVQGMPLAIEMAATWLRTLPCSEIAEEIQNSLDFLHTHLRNFPERHRNVRAVFEQSYRMLSPDEQNVFVRLSLFQGSFSRKAAHAVAGALLPILQSLVDKSLVNIASSGRYYCHQLLRQYAAERLSQDPVQLANAQDDHCAYFMDFIASKEAHLKGPQQAQALAEIDLEVDDLRVAWSRAVTEGHTSQVEAAMGSLVLYLQMRGRQSEGLKVFQRTAEKFRDTPGGLDMQLLIIETWFYSSTGHDIVAGQRLTQMWPILSSIPLKGAMAMPRCTIVFNYEKFLIKEQVWKFFEKQLADSRQMEDLWNIAFSLYCLGYLESRDGLTVKGQSLLNESIRAFRACGDRWGSTWPLHELGARLLLQGSYTEARSIFQETLSILQEIGDLGGVSFALHFLGEVAAARHEFEGSLQYMIDAIKIAYELDSYMTPWHLYEMARSYAAIGQMERAVELMTVVSNSIPAEISDVEIRPMLEEFEAELPAEVFKRARSRGDNESLPEVIKALSVELEAIKKQDAGQRDSITMKASQPAGWSAAETLSERELEVLQMVAEGFSNREIAHKLVVTTGTVKKHINNIFGKLQVQSRTQAVARARLLNLIQ